MIEINNIFSKQELALRAKELFREERAKKRLDGWFLTREMFFSFEKDYASEPECVKTALVMKKIIENIPISISTHAIYAATQDDAFAKSYALINPSFDIKSFMGYCDPTAVYNDIEPNEEFPVHRIEAVREKAKATPYVKALNDVYNKCETLTSEVAFFIEQVTGHLIPDFRQALKTGIRPMINELESKNTDQYRAMKIMLEAVILLAKRYADLAAQMAKTADTKHKQLLQLMQRTLRKVPENGAENLYEAIQSYLLLWQVMCLEQAPNPFAFSVGNADRIFEPYRSAGGTTKEEAAQLFKHLLVFYNVGDRSWAISQNLIVGGRDTTGNDLSNEMTYAILDAYFDMNLPQPILSVKLHRNTPSQFYKELGKFLFSPGVLTPSFFNDDSVFEVLRSQGIDEQDLPDYSVAGCQEMLIMGKENANTTNSWLNLAKILELTLHGGFSAISGKKIIDSPQLSADEILKNIRNLFYKNLDYFIDKMVESANDASRAISLLPVPFLSCFMGGMQSGVDVRDCNKQGTKYNGSGCLIHGLSIVSDSFTAIDSFIEQRPNDLELLISALKNNFEGYEEIRDFLKKCPKYGNNHEQADKEACTVMDKVSNMVSARKNYLGRPFKPDWASPSTHLLYGYWVGATPDSRSAREMLGYGIDPLFGEATNGLGFRVLSNLKLNFRKMTGGYASHFGIDPKYFTGTDNEQKGEEFGKKIINPLFYNEKKQSFSPFYIYVNVTTPETLRKVLESPKKYAPSGVYIVRIHGTFVNFLDLSPAIQNDIISRLDLKSTLM